MSTDLAPWLLAQIAADEAAIQGRAFDRPIHFVGCYYYSNTLDAGRYCDCFEDDDATGFFLAELQAKRRIVQQCVGALALAAIDVHDEAPGLAEDVLRLLALPYADRPGYREEWKP